MSADDRTASGHSASFLNCPSCGLTIRTTAYRLAMEYCPRCIARSRKAVRLFASMLPAVDLYAAEAMPDIRCPDAPPATNPST